MRFRKTSLQIRLSTGRGKTCDNTFVQRYKNKILNIFSYQFKEILSCANSNMKTSLYKSINTGYAKEQRKQIA